jgi:hypothetical protein
LAGLFRLCAVWFVSARRRAGRGRSCIDPREKIWLPWECFDAHSAWMRREAAKALGFDEQGDA